jgi:hypothetical protein
LPVVALAPLYLVALLSLLLGFLTGELHARIGRHRLKRELRRRARDIEGLKRELAMREGRREDLAVPSRAVTPLRDRAI